MKETIKPCLFSRVLFCFNAFRQLSEAKQKTTRYAGGEQKVKQKITFQVQ
jgi:hypothetical protein